MRALILFAIATPSLLLSQSLAAEPAATVEAPPPSQSVGERVGESVDRGLTKLGDKIRKTWAEFRKSVDELSVQGRVYARFHWDKALAAAPIEITVQDENVVTLTGTVPNETARRTAVTLANDTVGVHQVIDRLSIAQPPAPPATAPVPSVPPSSLPPQ